MTRAAQEPASDRERPSRHIKIDLEYDGTRYCGWQTQKPGGSVQDTVAFALHAITGEKVRLVGASRTDAGVHAFGQVASFQTGSRLTPDVLMRALNAKLPRDIRIKHAGEAPSDFHPRFSALKKRYLYFIANGKEQSAFFFPYVWRIPERLDLDGMQAAAHLLKGTHDYSSFRAAGCSAKTCVRTIFALDLLMMESLSFMTVPHRGRVIKISVEGNAFLRHMVRNIAGTLVEVGRGRIATADIPTILQARDRGAAGPTAPAHGLFLEEIIY